MRQQPQIRSDRTLLAINAYDSARTQRQQVLHETLDYLREHFQDVHQHAQNNLKRWQTARKIKGLPKPQGQVEMIEGDWGEVTLNLTQNYGQTFAVLNMANAYVAGGAYQRGTAAQEENMFRRTDCHLALHEEELLSVKVSGPGEPRYKDEMTDILNAKYGRVSLDVEQARVCVRGSETQGQPGAGYSWLDQENIFPFYELKAAAVDLRYGRAIFDPSECKRRFNALLDTIKDAGVEYAILGAHGCGAFANPSHEVAKCYASVLQERKQEFALIAFAIYHAGYGPNNYQIFKEVFQEHHII